MKKNTTQKMILITLLFVMIALVLVASTYAKYTSNASGSASARVAKWSFNIGTDNDEKRFYFLILFRIGFDSL